jgi:hypothetical protein
MKHRMFKLLVAVVFPLALIEGLCSALAWSRYGTLDVAKINSLDIGNSYASAEPEGYVATLKPEPYFGWVRKPEPGRVNAIGTIGNEFPLKKDQSRFTILFTGGSVCSQLCESHELERALSGFGNVLILNGSSGAWKQPHQTIALARFGEVCDAVVALDGWNEHFFLCGDRRRLESPGTNFTQINPLLDGGYDRLGASWQCNQLRRFSSRHNLRSVFFVTKALRAQIESTATASEDASFNLPAEWTAQECSAFNLAQLQKYAKEMKALANVFGIKHAHFIQPCPTPDAVYRKMAADLDAVSLLDVFADTEDSVYVDAIHCNRDGYRIMAKRIAADLARLWQPEHQAQK